MKKINKILLSSTATVTVIAPVVAVVSCSLTNKYGEGYAYWGTIQTITDAGSVDDKTFNQSAFEAGMDFAKGSNGKETFGFAQPDTASKISLQKAYLTALKNGVKTIILPGFTHSDAGGGDAINFAINHKKDYPDTYYISPDGFASDEVFGTKGQFGSGEKAVNRKGNFYNLGYASQESGFLDAIANGLYFKNTDVKHAKLETFGGVAIPYGVTAYMDGFLQGVNWFNNKNTKDEFDLVMRFADGNKASIKDFSGSFDPGGATAMIQAMVSAGVKSILPVAGPQTGDVTGIIAKNKLIGQVFANGVDVDQTLTYGDKYFIGSAIKGIYASVYMAIEKLKNNSQQTVLPPFATFNKKLEESNDFKQPFIKLKNYLENKFASLSKIERDKKVRSLTQFTGFIPSDNFSAKVSDFETNKIYGDALKFVSNGSVSVGISSRLPGTEEGKQNVKQTYAKYGSYLIVADDTNQPPAAPDGGNR